MVRSSYPSRNKDDHAKYIKGLLDKSYRDEITQKQVAAIRYKKGMYLEFSSAPNYDLEVKSLENRTNGYNWDEYTIDEFIQEVDDYMHWYREERIKATLGGLSPLDYRRSMCVTV